MDIKLTSIVYKLFGKKIGSGAIANVNETVDQQLHKPVIKTFKKGECSQGLKIIFGQQI